MSQYISENNIESEGLLYIARSWDERDPLKVRKIRLLQALDLPLDETYLFTREAVRSGTSQILSTAERLFLSYRGVFVRTAWIPDLFNAPWFQTFNINELKQVLHELALPTFGRLHSNSCFTHLILHGELSNPYDPTDKYRHIAGRLLFHPCQDIPSNRTIEVVYGEYIAKIFDTKGFDFSDDRFASYKINVGQMCWHPLKESPWISVDDMLIILNSLKRVDDKLRQLMKVLAFVARKNIANLTLVVEFVASKGSEKVFFIYDFDYTF